jgi:hypothetical protein
MPHVQEAYGKLQEWTVSSEAASHKLAKRAGALQEAMQVGEQGRGCEVLFVDHCLA